LPAPARSNLIKKSQLDRLKGACDMVALASATWKSGTAQVELQYIGTPVLANRKPSGCQTNDTSVLEISGFAADEPANSLAEYAGTTDRMLFVIGANNGFPVW
jgi:hypothetical protein